MTLSFITASEVAPQESQWLWKNLIPLGAITIVEGDPGHGKSSIVCDIAARITTGRPMPFSTGATNPASVILLQAEDHPQMTIVPRLKAAGADLARVSLVEGNHAISFPADVAHVEEHISRVRAKLLVIDPISSYISGNLNSDRSVREALMPVVSLAENHSLAVLIIRHCRKTGSRNVLHSGAGSIGIIALARSALMVGRDPASAEKHQHVLALTKSNLATAPALVYRTLARESGAIGIEWLEERELTTEELTVSSSPSNDLSAVQEAMYVLYSILADGALPARDVAKRADQARVASRTLYRAKKALKVKSLKRGSGAKSQWFWKLPDDDSTYRAFKNHDLDHLMNQLVYGDVDDLELPTGESASQQITGRKRHDDDDPPLQRATS